MCGAAVKQKLKLKKLRENRDQSLVDKALKNLNKDIADGTNCMPAIVEACSVYATLGEISDVFRFCFGEYQGMQNF